MPWLIISRNLGGSLQPRRLEAKLKRRGFRALRPGVYRPRSSGSSEQVRSISKRGVGGASNLAFDLWNITERTAFEISLGPLKNEFEKDLLKGLLDKDTTKLVILFRVYGHGTRGVIYGHKWVEQPAQREMIERAGIFKLKVNPVSLLGPIPPPPSSNEIMGAAENNRKTVT